MGLLEAVAHPCRSDVYGRRDTLNRRRYSRRPRRRNTLVCEATCILQGSSPTPSSTKGHQSRGTVSYELEQLPIHPHGHSSSRRRCAETSTPFHRERGPEATWMLWSLWARPYGTYRGHAGQVSAAVQDQRPNTLLTVCNRARQAMPGLSVHVREAGPRVHRRTPLRCN